MNDQETKPLWVETMDKVLNRIQYHKRVMGVLDKAELIPNCSYYYYSGISLNQVDNYEGFLDVLKRIRRTGLKVIVSSYTNIGSNALAVSLNVVFIKDDVFSLELTIRINELEESLKRISNGRCHVKKEIIKPSEFTPYESTYVACDARP